jgi:hypothetical protein
VRLESASISAFFSSLLERIPIEWNISGAGKVVGTFLGREAIKQITEGVPET